jgi:hypothetical protein
MLAGALALYWEARGRVEAVSHWATTQGVVVATDLDRQVSTSRDSKGRTSTSVSYEPIVFFTYVAGGKTLRSKSLWLNDPEIYSDAVDGDAFLSNYRIGKKLVVRYDPSDLTDAAVILNGPSVGIWIVAGMGIIFFGAGILVWRVFRNP